MMKDKNVLVLFVGLLAFVMSVGGISYANFVYNKDLAEVGLTSGKIDIHFTPDNNDLSITNVQTMNDATGMIYPEYLDFSVVGTADTDAIKYEVELVPNDENTIDTRFIKVYMTDYDNNVILSPIYYNSLSDVEKNNGKVLHQGLIEGEDGLSKTTTINYRLRVWIDEEYVESSLNKFDFSIYLYAYNTDATKVQTVDNLSDNLMYGLDNTDDYIVTKTELLKYRIQDGVINAISLADDGYGYTSGRVNLKAGRTYLFNCKTNGVWKNLDDADNSDTVEAYLTLDGENNDMDYHMDLNNNYSFTVLKDGTYWLRLDVNENNKEYVFYDVEVKEKYNTSLVTDDE